MHTQRSSSTLFFASSKAAPTLIAGVLTASVALLGCVADSDEVIVNHTSTRVGEISSGTTTTIEQNPWQVILKHPSGRFCSGSILGPSWVVTAQHCLLAGEAGWRVTAGVTTRSEADSGDGIVRNVDAVLPFPGYVSELQGKDVALLHLDHPLSLTGPYAKKIELVTHNDVVAGATRPGISARVTGWGATTFSQPTLEDKLRSADVTLISNAQATADYGNIPLTQGMIAAAGNNEGMCASYGDSGAPLTVLVGGKRKLAGVGSWNVGCGGQLPGVYARTYNFYPWLQERIASTFTVMQELTNLSGTAGSFAMRTVAVPAGTLALSVMISGGNGEADLYVRAGTAPTQTAFDCRPYLDKNFEYCTLHYPTAGTWHIGLRGEEAYAGVSLKTAVVTP